MHADMTAVTIQSNKIVSNEVKKKLDATRAILLKKNKQTFWPTQYKQMVGKAGRPDISLISSAPSF